jgi:hypothetical protein
MSRLARVLLAATIAIPLIASMPGRAVACDCAGLDAGKIVKHADAIVAGHVVSQTEVDPVDTRSELAVDGVYKGDVGATLTLSAALGPSGGSDCAVLYPVGSRIDPLVLTGLPDGTYAVDVCSMAAAPQITKLIGTARPPPEAAATAAASPPLGTAASPAGGVSWPAVAGGVAVAVGLIAFALWRSGRRHAEEVAVGDVAAADASPGGGPTTPEPSD